MSAFVYPIRAQVRTAILRHGFRESKVVRTFDSNAIDFAATLAEFRPEALAGSYRELIDALRTPAGGLLGPEYPLRAVIVFSDPGEGLLAESERDRLWQVVQAPIFEQLLLPGGELLAAECEAHNGLHVTGESRRLEVAGSYIEDGKCGCGDASPRLLAAQTAAARQVA